MLSAAEQAFTQFVFSWVQMKYGIVWENSEALGEMPLMQTQLKARDVASHLLDVVAEEVEFWRQRRGQAATWEVHHDSAAMLVLVSMGFKVGGS